MPFTFFSSFPVFALCRCLAAAGIFCYSFSFKTHNDTRAPETLPPPPRFQGSALFPFGCFRCRGIACLSLSFLHFLCSRSVAVLPPPESFVIPLLSLSLPVFIWSFASDRFISPFFYLFFYWYFSAAAAAVGNFFRLPFVFCLSLCARFTRFSLLF